MRIKNVSCKDNNSIGGKLVDNCDMIAYLSFNDKFEKDGDIFYNLTVSCVVEDETLDPFSYRSDFDEMMRMFYYKLDFVNQFLETIPNSEILLNADGTTYSTNYNEDCFELYDDKGSFIKDFNTWFKTDEYLYETLKDIELAKMKTLENTNN